MKKNVSPIKSVCRNCGASLVGRYCHVCGQDVFAGTSRRLRDVMANSLDVVFAFDNKIWHSLVALVAFPGRLTKDYLNGKIQRYVHPSKMFWFLSIVFFALLLSGTEEWDKHIGNAVNSPEQAAGPGTAAEKPKAEFKIEMGDNTREEISNLELFGRLKSAAPYLMLVMVPLFALLVWMFYRRRGYYYADYLIFALHYHSFLFLLFSVWMGFRFLFPAMGMSGVIWIVVVAPTVYLLVSLRTVFGAKIVPAVFKIAALWLMYAISMAMVVSSILVFWAGVIKGLESTL